MNETASKELLKILAKSFTDEELKEVGLMRIEENNTTLIPQKDVLKENPKEDYEHIITKILKDFGVPAHLKGYGYLRHAIVITLKEPNHLDSVTKDLYPTVAKHFKTTPSRTERAIRHAIEVAAFEKNPEFSNELFGSSIPYESTKPTNAHFIAAVVDYVKLHQ